MCIRDRLSVREGDSLYLQELVDGEWYRAKRRHVRDDGSVVPATELGEDAHAEGLVPANYVQEAAPLRHVQALYDYEAQNEDELSISEGDALDIYEVDDQWLLARKADAFGMVPANYVGEDAEVAEAPAAAEPAPAPAPEPAAPAGPRFVRGRGAGSAAAGASATSASSPT